MPDPTDFDGTLYPEDAAAPHGWWIIPGAIVGLIVWVMIWLVIGEMAYRVMHDLNAVRIEMENAE